VILRRMDGEVIGMGDTPQEILGRTMSLRDANLRGLDLCGVMLSGRDLRSADMYFTRLRGADLSHADLRAANLGCADLIGANLCGANLLFANLQTANLDRANIVAANLPHFQIPDGNLTVWGKKSGSLVRLLVPATARRTACLVSRKCRAEYVVTQWIEGGLDAVQHVSSSVLIEGTITTTYSVGEETYPDMYDDDPRVDCSHGIHFFLTEQEAREW
jgi:hypothetical protein